MEATPPAGSVAPPAAGITPPAGDAGSPPLAAATRPDWLPESYFDPATGIKPEFGAHYAEIATAQKTFTEQQAALAARKPEDIKFELKLPETVKLPEGVELKVNPDDPRIPILRDLALKNNWTQDQVDALVALDAQQVIASHTAEAARLTAEKSKLGANADDRIKAVASAVKTLPGISADELAEVQVLTATASGVSFLERLLAKANGAVPGAGGHQPQTPSTPATVEQRWYGQKG